MKARTLLAFTGALACVCATLFAAPTPENTPDKFVRYVEATGSQYVDTGIVGRYNTKAECKVEWMNFTDSAFLACGDWSDNTRFFMCHCSTASGNMFAGYRTGSKVTYDGSDLLFEKKRVYTYTSDYSAPDGSNNSTNTVYIDETKVFTKVATALDTELSLYVFSMNHKGSAYGNSKTRCYGLKIWQDGALVREFKPCVKNGRAGLYDTVSETIFYSGSGKDLTYDPNSDVPDAFIDYVESFGNSYIDTKVIGRSGTAAKMEMAWMGTSSDQALLDSRDGTDKRFYLAHRNGGDKWLWGYGSYGNFGSLTPGERYHVDSSYAVGAQTITVREGGSGGTVVSSYEGTSDTDIDTGRSLYLFCCNQSGGTLAKQYWGKARVYWLQIFQDGVMVRDFKPCLKYGEAALYDDVSKTIFYPEGDPLGYDNSVAANPDEVVYVDYIESDGFTHLDTQVAANSPTRATGTFSWTQVRSTNEEKQYLDENYHSYLACGCYNSGSDANRFYLVTQTAQKPWIGYGNNSASFGSAYAAGTKYAFDVSFAAGAQSVSLVPEGGSDIGTTASWSGEASGCSNLYLFACNDAKNKKPIYRSAARCYGLTIYQGGETPVRNFKPCVKDGQAALYDTVSERIFYPVPAIPAEGNTGAVTEESALSPVEAYLEYVETDGTQYIDTGVIGKAGTVAEFIETNLRPNGGAEECFLGAIGSDANSRFYMWYHGGIDTLAFGYANSYWRPSKDDPDMTATQWSVGYEDVYRLYYDTTTHAKVEFSAGSQKVTTINDSTGEQTVISRRTLADDIDTGKALYVFARNNNGSADSFAKSRLYWLKVKQDGSYVRKFQPVRLKNGLVGLWDFVEEKTYLPKTSTGGLAYFSAVGPEAGKLFNKGFVIIVR
ncbi:MAG: hypothetical protein IJ173_11125 [Kiritimatiellae bacterium]|nr:hypothetical protein [Kiritimatiellia bacterium]